MPLLVVGDVKDDPDDVVPAAIAAKMPLAPPPTTAMRNGVCFDAVEASDDTTRVDVEKVMTLNNIVAKAPNSADRPLRKCNPPVVVVLMVIVTRML